jgi:hypothetical protein
MRLRLASATVLIVLAACGSSATGTTTSASGPPARPPACGPQQARTLAFSGEARAYVLTGTVYGCSVPAHRRFRLGSVGLFRRTRIDHVAVGGRIAAYGLASMGVDTRPVEVIVRRLTDGMQLGSFSATNAEFAESFQSIGSIVVRGDGAVAWIGQLDSIGARRTTIQVLEAHPSDSRGTVLDSGTAITPDSLRLHGSSLTWRHGGATRHATLR